ncbi:MAG TPA: glutamate-5-semialdehyde dehydrogenase [Clostridiales bacterium]|nr:glutamate-5-semialdehyde dehydrogenase [Clostridiales bacterium]
MTTLEIFKNAHAAVSEIRNLSTEIKNAAIENMAVELINSTDEILKNNAIDIEKAKGVISDAMIDRLALSVERIEGMAKGMREVAALPDPNGEILETVTRPNGLVIEKTLVPMGVIGIIYESRPNVTSDAAVLCFKSSNVCVLRSGKEAYNSAKAIVNALRRGLEKSNINPDAVQLIDDTTRQSSIDMMTAVGYIDLLIPRGGKGLIRACIENAKVNCIATGTGICHIYVEKTADFDMALNIIHNAKTSRPSVCNACEVCVIDKDIAADFLPKLYDKLTKDTPNPVRIIGDEEVCKIIPANPADEDSFDTEFLDYILAIKIVNSYKEAVEHISIHATGHSDAIISNDAVATEYFLNNTDSAAVYVNASTRFTDGGEFGLGCEMGISTQKLHARGPMGLRELMTYHYVVKGKGQIR